MTFDPLEGFGPPPGGAEAAGPTPIGGAFDPSLPPEAFLQERLVPAAGPFLPGRPETFPVARGAPRYLSGFEFTPAGWSVEDRARMQETLDSAGLYTPGEKYTRGWWDENSAVAFKRLLSSANQMGKSWEESIVEIATLNRASAGRARTANRQGRAPTYTELTSPDDLKIVFDRTARQQLGRKLSEGELNSMTKAYSGLEMAEAQKRIGAAGGEADVIATGLPSPTAFGERQVESQFGEEAFANRFAQKFDVFNKILGGIQ